MCPMVWCRYNRGGFARKDKVQTHVKNGYHGESRQTEPGFNAGQIQSKGQDELWAVK